MALLLYYRRGGGCNFVSLTVKRNLQQKLFLDSVCPLYYIMVHSQWRSKT